MAPLLHPHYRFPCQSPLRIVCIDSAIGSRSFLPFSSSLGIFARTILFSLYHSLIQKPCFILHCLQNQIITVYLAWHSVAFIICPQPNFLLVVFTDPWFSLHLFVPMIYIPNVPYIFRAANCPCLPRTERFCGLQDLYAQTWEIKGKVG